MRLINYKAEIEQTVFDVLTSLAGIVQASVGNQAVPPGGDYDVRVMAQNDANVIGNCYPQTDLSYPPYSIRLCCCTESLRAAAAYEFAHELCHVWLGLRSSCALAEVICECASWYFTSKVHEPNGIAYDRFLVEPNHGVVPAYDADGKVVVPLLKEQNHSPAGRNAMVVLAKDHLVKWIHNNPSFWQLLPQLGTAMCCNQQAQDLWNDTIDVSAITEAFSGDERDIVMSFFGLIEAQAVFQLKGLE